MRSLIVTAGNGEPYGRWARLMEAHVNEMAKGVPGAIPCIDLSSKMPWGEMGVPRHCKYYIWKLVPKDIDRIIWLDTDTFMLRPITEQELPDHPFCAVRDPWLAQAVKRKILMRCLAVFTAYKRCFNSGVMVCTRDAIPAFDLAFKHRSDMFKNVGFQDQHHFNWAVHETLGHTTDDGAGWYELGKEYNTYRDHFTSPQATVLHFTRALRGAHGIGNIEDCYEGKAF